MFVLLAVFLHKRHFWGKSGSWDMAQMLSANQIALAGFFSPLSIEQSDEKAWFSAFC